MVKIYQLMIDDRQINDVYYNEDAAVNNAIQFAIDFKKSVSIWGAEENEAVPVDALVWTIYGVVSVLFNSYIYSQSL